MHIEENPQQILIVEIIQKLCMYQVPAPRYKGVIVKQGYITKYEELQTT